MKQLFFKILKIIKPHLLAGPLSILFRIIYELTIFIELVLVRVYDLTLYYRKAHRSELVDLTVVIKTFERPREVKRLVRSIRRFYPKLKIIVVDDSQEPLNISDVKMVHLPFNTGISTGRNKALELINTDFFLLLDDDFILSHHTALAESLQIMRNFNQIDIIGGNVIDLPLFYQHDYTNKANLFPTTATSVLPNGSLIAGLPVYDKVPNFFIARTERIKLIKWDERLKKIEHTDFFTRAKGVLTTVYNKDLKILHAKTPFNKYYMKFRNDFKNEQTVLKNKYYKKGNYSDNKIEKSA